MLKVAISGAVLSFHKGQACFLQQLRAAFARLSGGVSETGSPTLPGASQAHPWVFLRPSKGLPRAFQGPSKGLPRAFLGPSRGLPVAFLRPSAPASTPASTLGSGPASSQGSETALQGVFRAIAKWGLRGASRGERAEVQRCPRVSSGEFPRRSPRTSRRSSGGFPHDRRTVSGRGPRQMDHVSRGGSYKASGTGS